MVRVKQLETLFTKASQIIRTKKMPNGNIKTQYGSFNKTTGLFTLETSVKKANGSFVYNSLGERNLATGVTEYYGHYNKNWLEMDVPEEFASFHISNLA